MRKISLLVPFRSDHGERARLWEWLHQYWRCELPDAEIIVADDPTPEDIPFSKTTAINEAFERSTGDIIVLLDADAYLPGAVIRHCARRLRHARRHHVRTWFVPYHHLYRLTEHATCEVLESDPCCNPKRFPHPPDPCDVEGEHGSGSTSKHANKYGALIQIMPREAFEAVGCMDPRFRGWGGEDVSFLRALDTLWGKHKNTHNDVFHLWHPKLQSKRNLSVKYQYLTRVWAEQATAGSNNWLATAYNKATGKPEQMRALIDSIWAEVPMEPGST